MYSDLQSIRAYQKWVVVTNRSEPNNAFLIVYCSSETSIVGLLIF